MSLIISCFSDLKSSTKVGDRITYDFVIKNISKNIIDGPFIIIDDNRGFIDLKISSIDANSSVRKSIRFSIKNTDILSHHDGAKIFKKFTLKAGNIKSNSVLLEQQLSHADNLKMDDVQCNIPIQRGIICHEGAVCANIVPVLTGDQNLSIGGRPIIVVDDDIWKNNLIGEELRSCPESQIISINGIAYNKAVASTNHKVLRIPLFYATKQRIEDHIIQANLYLFYNIEDGYIYFAVYAKQNILLKNNAIFRYGCNGYTNIPIENSKPLTPTLSAIEGRVKPNKVGLLANVEFFITCIDNGNEITIYTGLYDDDNDGDNESICLQINAPAPPPEPEPIFDAELNANITICGEIQTHTDVKLITAITNIVFNIYIKNTGTQTITVDKIMILNPAKQLPGELIFMSQKPIIAPGDDYSLQHIVRPGSGGYEPIVSVYLKNGTEEKNLQKPMVKFILKNFLGVSLRRQYSVGGVTLQGDLICSDRHILTGTELTSRYTIDNRDFLVKITRFSDGNPQIGDLLADGPIDIEPFGQYITSRTSTVIEGRNDSIVSVTSTTVGQCPDLPTGLAISSCYFGASPDLKVELCVKKMDCVAGNIVDCIHPSPTDVIKIMNNNPAMLMVKVSNTGNVPLSNISLSNGINIVGFVSTLAVDEAKEISYIDLLSANYSISAKSEFKDTVNQTINVNASDELNFMVANPSYEITLTRLGGNSTDVVSPLAQSINYLLNMVNTGNVPLTVISCQDSDVSIAKNTIQIGGSISIGYLKAGPFIGQEVVETKTCIEFSYQDIFCNKWESGEKKLTFATNVGSLMNMNKLTNGFCGDQQWSFELRENDYSGVVLESFTTGNGVCQKSFTTVLDKNKKYALVETIIPVGWKPTWTCNNIQVTAMSTNDDNGTGYVLLGAGTQCPLASGQIILVIVNNIRSITNGEARSPGYWRNWNTCSKGNQSNTADINGGVENGFYLLNNLLPINLYNCIVDGQTRNFGFAPEEVCGNETKKAVSILDRRDIDSNQKKGNDVAYKLAMHLLTALLNYAAGAKHYQTVTSAIKSSQQLLCHIDFVGTGDYIQPNHELYQQANSLAEILELYNSNNL